MQAFLSSPFTKKASNSVPINRTYFGAGSNKMGQS